MAKIDAAVAMTGIVLLTVLLPPAAGGRNESPVFSPPIGDKNAFEGATLAFDIRAIDPEGKSVTYSIKTTLAGASLGRTTGAFSWTPSASQVGSHSVTFAASDGQREGRSTITIVVAAAQANVTTVFVRDFGAVAGDGADDTAGINAAVGALGGQPGRVVFETGVYFVGSKSGATAPMVEVNEGGIVLEGRGATLRARNHGVSVVSITGNNVTLTNLTLDGNRTVIYTVYARGVWDLTLRALDVKGADQSSLAYDSASRNAASGVFVDEACYRVTIENNRVHDISGSRDGVARGIMLSGMNSPNPSRDILIRGNLIEDIRSVNGWDADGIHVQGGSKAMTVLIENNTFTAIQKRGIKVQSPGVTITKNVIENPSSQASNIMYSGISVYASDVTVHANVIKGGFFTHGIELGTSLAEIARVHVTNNTVKATPGAAPTTTSGISAPGALRDARIENNSVDGFQYGARLYKAASNVSILANRITNMTSRGIIMTEGTGPFSAIVARDNTFVNGGKYLVDAMSNGTGLAASRNTGTYLSGGAVYSSGAIARVAIT